MNDFKVEDLLKLGKLNSLIVEKKKNEDFKKTLRIILICVGAVTVIAGIAYLVYRLVNRYDDYDLYDDLDFFYDDDEGEDVTEEETEEEPENEEQACEQDFAE